LVLPAIFATSLNTIESKHCIREALSSLGRLEIFTPHLRDPGAASVRRWVERRVAGNEVALSLPVKPGSIFARLASRTDRGCGVQIGVHLCTIGEMVVEFEWDPYKAAANVRKHGVRLAEAVTVLEDDASLIMPDDDLEEDRLVGGLEWVLSVGFSWSSTQLGKTASGSFSPAKPRGASRRNTSEDADEKGIRF
jgi:hypothetical protein